MNGSDTSGVVADAPRSIGPDELGSVMTKFRDALAAHQESINRLNVYPVPDGDTGTNMALTVESVVKELQALGPERDMASVCKAIAHGSLMGARGNSGVILSQLLRGMSGVLGKAEHPGAGEVSAALRAGSDAADQAVLRPVEGTILTVARAAADGAESALPTDSVLEVLEAARQAAAEALERTPQLLPTLAQAGVVDAGGCGFLLLLDAALSVTDGRPIPEPRQVEGVDSPAPALGPTANLGADTGAGTGTDASASCGEDGTGGTDLRYEVMYLLEADDDTIPAFKEVWAGIGDSIVIVGGDGLWNCHIHTNDIGPAIEAGLDAGRPRNIRVTDLLEEIEEERWVREGALAAPDLARQEPPRRTAVVAVANGEGIGRIFRSLGVQHLVPGGQSMNPSTEQILAVVEGVPSPEVVILPNNENIHPVANQVRELATKQVRVVPTSGIVEGFAALLEYDPQASAEENARAMAGSARRVVAGEVTQAVRDATGPAGQINKGDWLGLSRDGVEVVGGSVIDACCGLLGKLIAPEHHEIVTLIEGEGARAADTRRITEWLAEHHPDISVEVHHGGQPLYPYLLSIE